MTAANPKIDTIPISRIHLDLENPRHDPYETESEAIEYLCKKEQVLELARDIADLGLNPLERLALVPIKKERGSKGAASYVSAEGNRRICAIKLLDDPELAPANLRKKFEDLSEKWGDIRSVPVAIFKTKDAARPWLLRLHTTDKNGITRRRWSADQQARFSGDSRNKVALDVLDYAEAKGLISADERKGKLTTAQRYLGNPLVREAFGLDNSDVDNISRTKSEDDFETLVGKFVGDLKSGHVNSRAKAKNYTAYARELRSTSGVSGDEVAAEPIAADLKPARKKPTRKKPRPPGKRTHIVFEDEISKKLKQFGNYKLENLYYSICNISVIDYTPLVSIGVWAFLETLTACAGRKSTASISEFLSKDRLQNTYQLGNREQTKGMREAVDRISRYGNTSKHDGTAAHFNSLQLANDVDTLKEVILKCIDEAISRKK